MEDMAYFEIALFGVIMSQMQKLLFYLMKTIL